MSQITQFPSQTLAPIAVLTAVPSAEVVSSATLEPKTILSNVMQMSAADDVPRTMKEVQKPRAWNVPQFIAIFRIWADLLLILSAPSTTRWLPRCGQQKALMMFWWRC